MSLLNDALRKKRSEQQTDGTLTESLPKLGAGSAGTKNKQVGILIGGAVILALLSCGTWLYWPTSGRSTGTKTNTSLIVTATQANEKAPTKPIEEPSTTVAADASTPARPPASAAKEAATPKTPRQPLQAPPEKQKPVAKPSPAKSKSPPTVQAVHKPEKRKAVPQPRPKAPKQSRPKVQHQRAAKPSNAQRQLRSERLYQKARQYHRRDRLEQAIALYREVIKIDPEHYNARFNLGAAYLQTESYAKAYYIMADLYLKEPDNQQAMLNLAVANIGLRRFDKALALLDKAAALPEPPLFEISLHKGIAYNHLNQIEDALNWYKRAEALRPDDPRLLFNLAVVSDQQQRYAEAIDYYRKHIDQNPEMNAVKEKQIRRRIRMLQAYHAQQNTQE